MRYFIQSSPYGVNSRTRETLNKCLGSQRARRHITGIKSTERKRKGS